MTKNIVKFHRVGCSPSLEGVEVKNGSQIQINVNVIRQTWNARVEYKLKDETQTIINYSHSSLWALIRTIEANYPELTLEIDDEMITESMNVASSKNYGFMGLKSLTPFDISGISERENKIDFLLRMLNSKIYDQESQTWLEQELKQAS